MRMCSPIWCQYRISCLLLWGLQRCWASFPSAIFLSALPPSVLCTWVTRSTMLKTWKPSETTSKKFSPIFSIRYRACLKKCTIKLLPKGTNLLEWRKSYFSGLWNWDSSTIRLLIWVDGMISSWRLPTNWFSRSGERPWEEISCRLIPVLPHFSLDLLGCSGRQE